jgi:hypothetical protein
LGGHWRETASRFGAVLGITLVAASLVPAPAEALVSGQVCAETRDRIARWGDEEAEKGLTTSLLDVLHQLIPLLGECSDAGITGGEGMGSDVDRWRDLVEVYFEAEDVDRVICLMEKESGGNPGARNRWSGAAGLMQVMPAWADVFGYGIDDLLEPTVNLWIASRILEEQGWGAWTPYLRGSCR